MADLLSKMALLATFEDMTKFLIILFILPVLNESALGAPTLFFESGRTYDRVCMNGFKYSEMFSSRDKIDEDLVKEVENRIDDFSREWQTIGPSLLKKLVDIFNKDFGRSQITIVLSACADAPSMSMPIILNVSRYLKNHKAGRSAKPLNRFPDLVFHELLHNWIGEHLIQGKSPILSELKDEDKVAGSHLHLFAIQKEVYKETGRGDLWEYTLEFFKEDKGAHGKALKIMQKIGSQKILQDLKQSIR